MSGMRLKSDNSILRYTDRSARNAPTEPLTEKEKKRLAENCWQKCLNAYKIRMIKSGLLSDYETPEDLEGEAYILMWNILNKFDKSKCGKISEFDEPGAKAPKTLEFYFKNYFYGRVNFTAAEARDYKKKRGVGPRGVVDEVVYDEESSLGNNDYKYESTGNIFNLLSDQAFEFRRFFVQLHILELTKTEMREEWGKEFDERLTEVQEFIGLIKKKHHKKYLEEIGKIRKGSS